jgi:hypothetical protein
MYTFDGFPSLCNFVKLHFLNDAPIKMRVVSFWPFHGFQWNIVPHPRDLPSPACVNDSMIHIPTFLQKTLDTHPKPKS